MWHVRLRMRVARPRARGRHRFSVGPSSAKHAANVQLLGIDQIVVRSVRGGGREALADDDGSVALAELQDLVGLLHLPAADEIEHLARLVRGHAHVANLGARARPLVGLHAECHVTYLRPRTAFSWPAW